MLEDILAFMGFKGTGRKTPAAGAFARESLAVLPPSPSPSEQRAANGVLLRAPARHCSLRTSGHE